LSESPSVVNIQYFGNFIYAILRSMNSRYLRLMKRDRILVSTSKARMGVVLIERSIERRQVFCIVFRIRKWVSEAES